MRGRFALTRGRGKRGRGTSHISITTSMESKEGGRAKVAGRLFNSCMKDGETGEERRVTDAGGIRGKSDAMMMFSLLNEDTLAIKAEKLGLKRGGN